MIALKHIRIRYTVAYKYYYGDTSREKSLCLPKKKTRGLKSRIACLCNNLKTKKPRAQERKQLVLCLKTSSPDINPLSLS